MEEGRSRKSVAWVKSLNGVPVMHWVVFSAVISHPRQSTSVCVALVLCLLDQSHQSAEGLKRGPHMGVLPLVLVHSELFGPLGVVGQVVRQLTTPPSAGPPPCRPTHH